jgi:hypothetical protein
MFARIARPSLPLAILFCACAAVRAALVTTFRAADDAAATRAARMYRDTLYTGSVPAWARHVG